jgi:carbamoyl-phosphate synthase large subunit
MGIGESFGIAFAKAQLAAGTGLPSEGQVFLSLADRDKEAGLSVARELVALGFTLAATAGTAAHLRAAGIEVTTPVGKLATGDEGANAVSLISGGEIAMVINTPSGRSARADGQAIRRAATVHGVACLTTASAALAAVKGIADTRAHGWRVRALQELH